MGREDAEPSSDVVARRARALELFAEHLEHGDLDEPAQRALIAAHPELERELTDLIAGLALFRAQRPALIRLERARRRARRTRTLVGAAAAVALAIAATLWFATHRGKPSTPLVPREDAPVVREAGPPQVPTAPKPDERTAASAPAPSAETTSEEILSTVAERGAALLEDVVSRPNWRDPTMELADGAGDAADSSSAQEIAAFFRWTMDVASAPRASRSEETVARLERIRTTLGVSPEPGRRAARAAIDSAEPLPPCRPFLTALKNDAEVRRLLAAPVPADASEAAARLLATLRASAVFRLRAFDLDSRGDEVHGAQVFGRRADVMSGGLGAPELLGRTPLTPCSLDAGDWRLIVVDDSAGRSPRHSELRVQVSPGEDAGLFVAFFRSTDDVTKDMAAFDACEFKFGAPAGEDSSTNLPQTTCQVPNLWIDPTEVSCEDYARFHRELELNRGRWFEGAMPVHVPEFLSKEGICKPGAGPLAAAAMTWSEAVLYANWAGKRLATEREWERVARGTIDENRKFPWGDAWDGGRVNFADSLIARLKGANQRIARFPSYWALRGGEVRSAVFELGATPESAGDAVYRLADNVSEFTEDLYVEHAPNGAWRYLQFNGVARVVRGGSWALGSEAMSHPWSRSSMVLSGASFVGLRCVKTSLDAAMSP